MKRYASIVIALVPALVALCSPARSDVMKAATVNARGTAVTATVGGARVTVLRACPREFFFKDSPGLFPTPQIDAGGTWLLVERVYPFEAHGRVDESTVLYSLASGRSYSSTYFTKALGFESAFAETWDPHRPATIVIYHGSAKTPVKLPGALAAKPAPDRCPKP